jgi:hypothetical protein
VLTSLDISYTVALPILEWSRALIKRIEEDFGAIDPRKDLCLEGKGMAAPDTGGTTPPGASPPAIPCPFAAVDVLRTRVRGTEKEPLSAQAGWRFRTCARRGRGRRTGGPSPGAGGLEPGRNWAGGAGAGPCTVCSGSPLSRGSEGPWRVGRWRAPCAGGCACARHGAGQTPHRRVTDAEPGPGRWSLRGDHGAAHTSPPCYRLRNSHGRHSGLRRAAEAWERPAR